MSALDDALGLPPEDGDPQAREQAALEGLKLCLYDDLSLAEIPPPTPLIDQWLSMDSLTWVFGEKGHCKSFVAMDMAACVANGMDWHGYAVKQVPVVYAALEGGAGIYRRVRTWVSYHGRDRSGISFLVPRPPLQIVRDGDALGALAEETGAGLVIIDTQNRATTGLDENSNVDMGRMIAALTRIKDRTGACVLVVHHAGIGTHRPRGHGSIDGAADAMIRVARDGRLVKVENGKQREGEPTRSLVMNLTDHDDGVVLVPSEGLMAETDSERLVCAALRDLEGTKDSVTHSDLKRACLAMGQREGTFNWALRRLIDAGAIMRDRSRYFLGNPDEQQFG